LLHDVGKPRTRAFSDKTKDWTFYEHDRIGAEIAEPIVARLLGHPLWEALVDELPRPLGAPLSRELVKRGRVYRPIALALHPSVLPLLPDDTPRAAVEALTFRHDLHRELA
ncbi:MAG TPA: hypothetical protein VFB66_01350, partial [Tepidisphaeraceae bacterium]|nr:hypothetical protein [Tepidisphaeraceae bacterium]